MKKTAPYLLLAFLTPFIGWSFLQPSGILSTLNNNLSLVNYVKQLLSTPDQFDPPLDLTNAPHVGMLAARQALRQKQPEKANELILPLLNFSDRAVQGTYAEILYANGKTLEAIKIWAKLKDTYSLVQVTQKLNAEGDQNNSLIAGQALYSINPEKYTYIIASVFMTANRLDEASQLLVASIKNYEDSGYSNLWYSYLTNIFNAQKNWLEAEQIYLQIITENPVDQKAWRNLGLLYLSQLKNPEKAIECFNKIIDLSPKDVNSHYLLAQAYEESGRLEDALKTFQLVLTISPDDQTALKAVERLIAQDQLNP